MDTLDLYPDANVQCITQSDQFVSDHIGIIPWNEILFTMTSIFGFRDIPFRWHDPMTFSDWARFFWLGTHPDTLYLDTDCRMLKPYPFEDDGLMIHSPGNICLMYSPLTGLAARLLWILKNHQPAILMDTIHHFHPSWSKPIPEEYFRHK
jgi:hypothetical protein